MMNNKNQLQCIEGRVIVEINMDEKNWHTMTGGTKIKLERKFDNFNARYTQPINATVVSAENIPAGSHILIHHNATHEVNKILNYTQVSGAEIASDIKYFSIPVSECFAWLDGDKWMPLPGFDFALRVFKPYNGILQGVEPTLIKDTLYVLTGEYKGDVCITLKSCDYQLIFQDTNGREGNIIRFRSVEDEKTGRECEIVAIHEGYTKQLKTGKLLIGLTKTDAKPLKELELI